MTTIVREEFTGLAPGASIQGRTPSPLNTPGNSWDGAAGLGANGATGGDKLNLTTSGARCFLNVATATHRVSVTRNALSGVDHILLARFLGPDINSTNGYGYGLLHRPASTPSSSVIRIARFLAGSRTDLVSGTATMSGDFTVGLEVSGTGATVTIKGYINGVQVISFDDTDTNRIVAGNYIGLYAETASSSAYYDDLEVDDLVAAPAAGGLWIPRRRTIPHLIGR